MSKLRWYKRDVLAALEGMSRLTLEEKGAYNSVLDLIYLHDGSVDDDPRYISGFLRCDPRVWKRIRARLIDLGKLYVADNLGGQLGPQLCNRRADIEVHSALATIVAKGTSRGQDEENQRLADEEPKKTSDRIDKRRLEKKESKEVGASPPAAENVLEGPLEDNVVPITPAKKYAFEGRALRLTPADYDKWRRAYHKVPDLAAELQAIDDYFSVTPPKSGGVFFAASRWLKKAHEDAIKASAEPSTWAGSF
jgi:hypothetical protein